MEAIGPRDAATVQSASAGASGFPSAHRASTDPIIAPGRSHSRLFASPLFRCPDTENRMEANDGDRANKDS
jgi:hypothetical protein